MKFDRASKPSSLLFRCLRDFRFPFAELVREIPWATSLIAPESALSLKILSRASLYLASLSSRVIVALSLLRSDSVGETRPVPRPLSSPFSEPAFEGAMELSVVFGPESARTPFLMRPALRIILTAG